MTIVVRHHEGLELNRVEYSGSITLAELRALADFNLRSPRWIKPDTLALVLPGADFRSVALSDLDALFDHYRALYEKMSFHIMRRSAWLCQSPLALKHVDYWVGGRDTRKGLSSHVRLFETYEEAGDWLLLQPQELDALKSGRDFQDIFRSEAATLAR